MQGMDTRSLVLPAEKQIMRYHVLIADDEPSVLSVLRLFFGRSGFQVTAARDGLEAIELAQQELPDAIILDLQMPRMSGTDVARQLRANPRFATTPIVAITAHMRDYLPEDVMIAGFDKLVTKPFELAALLKLIRGMIDEQHHL